jgi:hypothetical protein
VIHVSIRRGAEPIDRLVADLGRCFANVAMTEVIPWCFVARAPTVFAGDELLGHLISFESAYDPQVDIAVFWVGEKSRWAVTELVPDESLAARITGRRPDVY